MHHDAKQVYKTVISSPRLLPSKILSEVFLRARKTNEDGYYVKCNVMMPEIPLVSSDVAHDELHR